MRWLGEGRAGRETAWYTTSGKYRLKLDETTSNSDIFYYFISSLHAMNDNLI